MSLAPIATLNRLLPDAFADGLQPLFEAAGLLADALYAERPFASYAELIDRAESVAARMSAEDQARILSAHPRIGESPELVSSASYHEQGYAAEADLPSAEVQDIYAALSELNRAFEVRFGFRFVVFVNGRPKSEIVEVLRQHLMNDRDVERHAGLRNMFLIAHDRLRNLTEQP